MPFAISVPRERRTAGDAEEGQFPRDDAVVFGAFFFLGGAFLVTLDFAVGTCLGFAGEDFRLDMLCVERDGDVAAGTGVPPVSAKWVCDARSSRVALETFARFDEAGAGAGVVSPFPAAAAYRIPRLAMSVRQQGVCAWDAPWSSGREERHGVSK